MIRYTTFPPSLPASSSQHHEEAAAGGVVDADVRRETPPSSQARYQEAAAFQWQIPRSRGQKEISQHNHVYRRLNQHNTARLRLCRDKVRCTRSPFMASRDLDWCL